MWSTQVEYLQTILIVFATMETVEIWQHSILFTRTRARLECLDGYLRLLLLCPFCLSPWIAAVFWLYVLMLDHFVQRSGLYGLLFTPIAMLAIARMANLLSDLTAVYNRTPKNTLPDEPTDLVQQIMEAVKQEPEYDGEQSTRAAGNGATTEKPAILHGVDSTLS